MFSRRDIVKFFGAGAIIAPVIGGKVEESATAQLIEVPKVKPVALFSEIPKGIDLAKVRSAVLVLEMRNGSQRSIKFDSAFGYGRVDPCALAGDFRLGAMSSPMTELGEINMGSGYLL